MLIKNLGYNLPSARWESLMFKVSKEEEKKMLIVILLLKVTTQMLVTCKAENKGIIFETSRTFCDIKVPSFLHLQWPSSHTQCLYKPPTELQNIHLTYKGVTRLYQPNVFKALLSFAVKWVQFISVKKQGEQKIGYQFYMLCVSSFILWPIPLSSILCIVIW